MSAKRIREIWAREAAATKGPWEAFPNGQIWRHDLNIAETERGDGMSPEQELANGAFIAESRTDVPWLLAQLEEARSLARTFRAGSYESFDPEDEATLKSWE